MYRSFLLATAATAALISPHAAIAADSSPIEVAAATPVEAAASVETVVVTAVRLQEARIGIETQIGASSYTVTANEIDATPGGENTLLNQVVLQMPGAVQDSFGQLHIRAEHNALQFRLNGVVIPEGISVFSQSLDPRLAGSVKLITGALPAEYGQITGGIVDIQTKTGLFNPGGQVAIYGGSHSEYTPSFSYGGSSGNFSYFVSGDYLSNTLGIESPDGSVDPLHDRTKQWHGFGFAQEILDANSSIEVTLGTSDESFQIPNRRGVQPGPQNGVNGLAPDGSSLAPCPDCTLLANGQFAFPSNNLNENQREITHFGIVTYLHSEGQFDYQISTFGRYSSLYFTPDPLGDLLFNGISQTAYKRDTSYGVQADSAYHLGDAHTIRAGFIYQADDLISKTSSVVLPVDVVTGNQTSDVPFVIQDNSTKHAWSYGIYVQDEWKVLDDLTLNYGVRWDQFGAFDSGSQLSPRVNAVWQPLDGTTIHAGYSRYFSPPPIELVATPDVAPFFPTTGAPPNTNAPFHTPKAERADYYDVGVNQTVLDGLNVGVDAFDKQSHNLIDEGQFGAPIILTPFNYKTGRQYGVEFTGTYTDGPFSAYANAAYERAAGKDIFTSEFNFTPADLAFIQTHFIPLDHEQIVTASAGASYLLWQDTRFSADLLYGSGLRKSVINPNDSHVPGYTQVNLGVSHVFKFEGINDLTARVDVINLFDEKYEIRDGTGVGVGATQFGPRRGFFVGLSEAL